MNELEQQRNEGTLQSHCEEQDSGKLLALLQRLNVFLAAKQAGLGQKQQEAA